MAVKVAISGFGRIGRNVLRSIAEAKRKDVQVVAVNDLASAEDNAHLFRYDSVHGRFPGVVKVDGDSIDVGLGQPIKVLAVKDPAKLPVEEPRHRYRDGVHGHLHRSRQGGGAPGSRRQARARLRPVQGRRPDGGLSASITTS